MSGYIGNIPVPQATQTRDVFTASAGQTSFATSGYTPGFVDVYLNGVKLVDSVDFTATNGSDVVLTTGATAGDTVEVLSYSTYEVNNQAFTGDFSVDGTTFKVDSTNNRVGIGTSSPDATLTVEAAQGLVSVKSTTGSKRVAIGSDAFTDAFVGTTTAHNLSIISGGNIRATFDTSGNVGIGTSSPLSTFEISAGANNTYMRINDTRASAPYVGSESGAMVFGLWGIGERMRIDSSGRVGIGTSSPLNFARLTINGAGTLGNPLGGIVLQQAGTDVFYISNVATNNNTDIDLWNPRNGYVRIGTNAQERLRINSSGRVGINNTGFGDSQLAVRNDTNGCFAGTFVNLNAAGWGISVGSDSGVLAYFYADGSRAGSPVGSISENGTSTSYNTTSDYRLKEDVQPMSDASDRVLALNPVNFAWKVDGSRVDGFLAHEVQDIVPEAITGTKDEVDADGNPVYQGIDQSKLVPLLTAALQEALAEIADLKARITALEA